MALDGASYIKPMIAGGWCRHTWTVNVASSAEPKGFYYIGNWMNWAVWGVGVIF